MSAPAPDAHAEASRFLATLDADWARHVAATGPCRLQPKPAREPFEALVRAVAYQQLHARAGDAILARLLAQHPGAAFPTPQQLLAGGVPALRACGFSAAKAATLLGLADAAIGGVVPTRTQALALGAEALIARLTALRGIGRWTVEMLLIYTLERADVLPADDFGVREGYRRLKRLDAAPNRRQMIELSRAWSPHRSAAAWYLWRVEAPA